MLLRAEKIVKRRPKLIKRKSVPATGIYLIGPRNPIMMVGPTKHVKAIMMMIIMFGALS